MRRVLTVIGARPQFVKAAVVSRRLREAFASPPFDEVIVHTGQHYDRMMSDVFFQELQIPQVAANLDVGSATAPAQTAEILKRLEPVVDQYAPNAILAYGDTNSTLAAALVSAQKDIPFIHAEAGERVFRRKEVPEEVNRVVADNIASLCLTVTRRAEANLRREGFARDRVRFVGDPMYDLFLWAQTRVKEKAKLTPEEIGLTRNEFHLATIHRVQNTRSVGTLLDLLKCLDESEKPVLLPVHPRVRSMLRQVSWAPARSLHLTEPLGYFDFLNMLLQCRRVVTDSGGVTREAFFAGRPCIIPMENSWWTEIIESGWAMEVGDDLSLLSDALAGFEPPDSAPQGLFGDGSSADKIIAAVGDMLKEETSDQGRWHPHGAFDELPKVSASRLTYPNYGRMLRQFQKRDYRFSGFCDHQTIGPNERVVLMRHDVDLDLEKASRMAQLEAEIGVRATYFLMVRTAHYNVFSSEGSRQVERILRLGHDLGLHFDCAAYPLDMTTEQMADACAREADMLARWFNKGVEIVSYHRPNKLVMSGDPRISAPRRHTYMDVYAKRIRYLSDSRGGWRDGFPTETSTFEQGKPMQILVHPIWWNEQATSPYETLLQYTQESHNALERSVARNNSVYRVGDLADCN